VKQEKLEIIKNLSKTNDMELLSKAAKLYFDNGGTPSHELRKDNLGSYYSLKPNDSVSFKKIESKKKELESLYNMIGKNEPSKSEQLAIKKIISEINSLVTEQETPTRSFGKFVGPTHTLNNEPITLR